MWKLNYSPSLPSHTFKNISLEEKVNIDRGFKCKKGSEALLQCVFNRKKNWGWQPCLSFLLAVGGKRDDIERERRKGKGRREETRREQVDLLINNHKVRQTVPGWVGPVRKQQLRICRACKGLKQHRSAFFVPQARALKGQGDTCWWLRGTGVRGWPGPGSAYQLARTGKWV